LSGLSGSSGSKIKFEATKFVVAPGQQSQPIRVPAANKSELPRTAKFRRTSGQPVKLTYTDATSDKPKGFEKEQPVDFPALQDKEPARYKKDPNDVSFP